MPVGGACWLCVWWVCSRFLASPPDPPSAGPPFPWTAQNFALSFLSPAGARTRQPENSKRAHFRAPALQTTPKFHARTPRERKKKENCGGRGKKKREILGPPPFGAPPFGWAPPFWAPPFWAPPYWAPPLFWAPPFWAPPFWAPPFWAPPFWAPPLRRAPHFVVPKFNIQKLAEVEFGRSRNWPKSKLAEVDRPLGSQWRGCMCS